MMMFFFVFFGWVIGGFVSGVSGFGAMMLALPILSLGLAPMDAILTCCIVAGPCSTQLGWLYRRFVHWDDMKWLWISCIPGCIFGTLMLKIVPASWLQIGIGLLIAIFIFMQVACAKATWHLPDSRASLVVTGMTSGFAGSSVSIPGVPIGIFVLLKHWDKDRARGTLGMFFLLCTWITVISQCAAGLYNTYLLKISAVGIAGCLLGQELGYKVGRHIDQSMFVKFAFCFLTCSAVMLFYKGVQAM
ncbi:MAG: sulfite exporter TauE/SafE family protein [Desulfovibrio sp.]|nr:sulfite exporter TauE/SafE family protein [Desulfovibrio sp.]